MKRVIWACLFAASFSLAARAEAESDLKVGDAAPKFESTDDDGKAWKSEDHVGKKIIVVYFYPADCTGGCTRQAQGFRDDMETLTKMGVEVVGVSGDSVANHKVFKKVEKLNFALLADEDGSVAKAFGVPLGKGGEAKNPLDAGAPLKRNVTAKRWTFIIGKDGKIAMKNTEVKAAEDSKAVLKAVESLEGK